MAHGNPTELGSGDREPHSRLMLTTVVGTVIRWLYRFELRYCRMFVFNTHEFHPKLKTRNRQFSRYRKSNFQNL